MVTACDSLQVTLCKIKLEKTNFIIDKGKFLCYNVFGSKVIQWITRRDHIFFHVG